MAEFDPIECVGTTDSGVEVNIFRGSRTGKMCIEIRHMNAVVLPADQAPRLMILLSLAHEKATREDRETPSPQSTPPDHSGLNCCCTLEEASIMPVKTEITITQCISVDAEIAEEIRWLNAQGVRTEGSCSGHGETQPTAMIKPSSVARARELGYTPWLVEDMALFEMKLRGQDFEPPSVLRETGRQPYADAVFSAGLVENHPRDSIYFKLERDGDEPLTVLLRQDEALSVVCVLSGALWSEKISE